MAISEEDVPVLEGWIASRLRKAQQPDWEESTVEDLKEYVSLVVQRNESADALQAQCEEALQDFLGTSTSTFVNELLYVIRKFKSLPRISRGLRHTSKPPVTSGASVQEDAGSVNRLRGTGQQQASADFHSQLPSKRVTSSQPSYHSSQQTVPDHHEVYSKRKRGGRSRSPAGRRKFVGSSRSRTPLETNSFVPYQPINASMPFGPSVNNQYNGAAAIGQMPVMASFDEPTPQMVYPPRYVSNFPIPSVPGPNLGVTEMPPHDGTGHGTSNYSETFRFPCPNIQIWGFCLKGRQCIFSHDGSFNKPNVFLSDTNISMAQPTSQGLNPTANPHKLGVDHTFKKISANSSSIIVLRIPVEHMIEQEICDYFRKFGDVLSVTIDGAGEAAIVEFVNSNSAHEAVSSPEPIFNNRFVSTRLFKGAITSGKIMELHNQSGKRGGYQMTIEEASVDNRDPRVIAEEKQQRRALSEQRAEYQRQKRQYDIDLDLLKKQLDSKAHGKGNGDGSRSSGYGSKAVDLNIMDSSALRKRKMVLEAELASIEAGQARLQTAGNGPHRRANQIDHRPCDFTIHILETNDYANVVTAINNLTQTSGYRVRLMRDPRNSTDMRTNKTTDQIIMGYNHHWQAKRMYDDISRQLGEKVSLDWGLGEADMMMDGIIHQGAEHGLEMGHSRQNREAQYYQEEEAPQDLDVAEDQNWAH